MSTRSKTAPVSTPAHISYARPGVLAKRLGLHKKTLLRWADRGLIHRHTVNRRVVLFDEAEVAALIAGILVV